MIFFWQWGKLLFSSFCSAVVFYTIIPLPFSWTSNWERITRWITVIGLILGGLLGLGDLALKSWGMPNLTRSGLIVALEVALTGGLHLDGAIDAADGLAVAERDRSLDVMKDSATGAFGVMAGTTILLLKTIAISELFQHTWLILMLAAGWGRWGQLSAIAFYPYLRATGKGAFHQESFRFPQDFLLGSFPILVISGVLFYLEPQLWLQETFLILGCLAIAVLTGYYFYVQLQGHTGDTYGAVVEWSEALILCLFTTLVQ